MSPTYCNLLESMARRLLLLAALVSAVQIAVEDDGSGASDLDRIEERLLRDADGKQLRGEQGSFVSASFDLRCCPLHATSRFRATTHAQLPLSPTFPVNLKAEAREIAGIPAAAHSFAFAYPSPTRFQHVFFVA